MPNEKLDDITVGELVRNGFLLNTGEVVALIHEVVSAGEKSNPRRFPQTAEDLRLTKAGELRIAPSAWTNAADDPRIAAASLLDALLPPPSSSTESAVPPPLRSLAHRLRASAATVDSANVRDLFTILSRYLAVDPRLVLQQLGVRASVDAVRASVNNARDGEALVNVSAEAPPTPVPDAVRLPSLAEDDALALFGSDAECRPEISPAQVVAVPAGRQSTRRAGRGGTSGRRRSSHLRQPRDSARDAGLGTLGRRVTERVRRSSRRASGSDPILIDALPAEAVAEPQAPGAEPHDVIVDASNGSQSLGLDGDMDVFRRPTADTSVAAAPGTRPDRSRSVRSTGPRLTRIAVAVVLMTASAYAGYTYTRWLGVTRTGRPTPGSAAPLNREATDNSPPAVAAATTEPPSNADPRPETSSVARTTLEDGSAADGAQPLNLPVPDGAFSPSFALNGRELFFHSGRHTGRLLQADLDAGGNASRIRPVPVDAGGRGTSKDYHVRPSPDGRLIAFDSDREGERGVYVANRDGSEPARVSGGGFAAVASWSPDMKWLAFVRAEPGRPKVWNLWLRDLASGELRRLTSFRSGQMWGASWFPDGTRLCFSREDQLTIFDLPAAASENFSAPRTGALVRTPAVSPDGQRIVFQVYRDGVWMLDLQNGSMSRILSDATAEEFAWHPDGQSIAYHSGRDGQWRIWVIRPPH